MAKFSIELNSHSLSYYQQCEKRFKYSERDLLVGKGDYYPFKRGEGISRFLALWYRARKRKYSNERLEEYEFKLFKLMARSPHFVNSKEIIDLKTKTRKTLELEDDKLHIATRLMEYFHKYRYEKYPIIAVEQGFSKILHEDKHVLFSYSGRPDLVLDYGRFGIGAMDHKSESRESNIAKFNNQFIGYTWALDAKVGIINYIGLQKDSSEGSVLRRDAFTFTQNQIDRWRSDTIEWYYRILHSIVNKKYLRSWRCEGKYGVCLYNTLCTSGTRKEELIKIKRGFNKLEKPYRSW